jgi:gluconolactonase
MVKILRDAGLGRLIESDALVRRADGLQFTEGPLWLSDGSLIFQDINAERTYRLGPDGSLQVVREQTLAANGQTFGPDGSIVVCEQNGRRISRISWGDWTAAPLVETWAGARLNSPNDVVARSDGMVYFTDPAYGVEPARSAALSGRLRL